MVKRKTPLPSPRKILNAVSKKLSPTTHHFYGQEENVSYLQDMFTRTVDKGESNSLLVLGPRGVGKSALVTHVLRSVKDHHVNFGMMRLFLQDLRCKEGLDGQCGCCDSLWPHSDR